MYSYYFDRPDLNPSCEKEQSVVEAGLETTAGRRAVPRTTEPLDRVRRSPSHRPRRGGRKTRGVVVLCLFLFLMVGCAAGALALNIWESNSLTDLDIWGGAFNYGGDIQFPGVSTTPKTLVGRAAVGDGTVLSLVSQPEKDILTNQDIYTKNIQSIVSIRGTGDQGTSLGTGIVLSESGYIITNHHVITEMESVTVSTLDGTGEYNALLVGSDDQSDLAVLKVEAQGLIPAEFGDSSTLQVGDAVFAIGNPLGEQLFGTMTDGIISFLNRVMTVEGHEMQLIQTSAALNSGNSGGALVNRYGQVIGVTTLKMSSNWNTIEGLGFAIPTETVKIIVDELIATGHISGRPVLGIVAGPSSYYVAESEGAPEGLWVESVNEKSDAYEKGLRSGDIIVAANGVPTPTIEALNKEKENLQVGEGLDLRIYRKSDYLVLRVSLVERYLLNE